MAEIIINGPEGRIEGRYHKGPTPNAPVALVLHPHPLYGGTMNNKIVYQIYQQFVSNGFSVMRFNFRGVGKSQGKYDEGIGELCDAATVLDWLQQQNPDASTCWIGGFSFGAWIALQLLMRRPEIEGFIAASPPASNYDFNFLAPCPSPGLITMGDRDEVVQEEAVAKLVQRVNAGRGPKIQYKMFPGADHYYRNCLDEFSATVHDHIASSMVEFSQRKRTRPDKKRRQLPRD